MWWQILLSQRRLLVIGNGSLIAGRELIIHTHLSSSEPPLLHQALMKLGFFSIVLIFPWYSSESRIILRRTLQFELTLEFISPLYVFKRSTESNCSTMQLVKPGTPKKLKMVDNLALSSKPGSSPGATNRSASRLDTQFKIERGLLKPTRPWPTFLDSSSRARNFFSFLCILYSEPTLQPLVIWRPPVCK